MQTSEIALVVLVILLILAVVGLLIWEKRLLQNMNPVTTQPYGYPGYPGYPGSPAYSAYSGNPAYSGYPAYQVNNSGYSPYGQPLYEGTGGTAYYPQSRPLPTPDYSPSFAYPYANEHFYVNQPSNLPYKAEEPEIALKKAIRLPPDIGMGAVVAGSGSLVTATGDVFTEGPTTGVPAALPSTPNPAPGIFGPGYARI
jgi:hypothetical protein